MRSIAIVFVFCATASAKFIMQSQCRETIDPGPCQGFELRYGYDTHAAKCKRFVFGGCMGNLNNFKTREDCEKACVESLETPAIRSFVYEPQILHNPYSQPENFFAPIKSARKTKPSRCKKMIEPGNCFGDHVKFGYDTNVEKCVLFVYGGCGGNKNRFNTMEECRRTCEN